MITSDEILSHLGWDGQRPMWRPYVPVVKDWTVREGVSDEADGLQRERGEPRNAGRGGESAAAQRPAGVSATWNGSRGSASARASAASDWRTRESGVVAGLVRRAAEEVLRESVMDARRSDITADASTTYHERSATPTRD